MAFGIGINTSMTEAGIIQGKQQEIACDCWFTSQGQITPRFVKYQDAEGFIHKIYDIQVHTRGKKNFCGINTMEFECSAINNGFEYRFRLLYQTKECKWKIIWER